MSWTFSELVDWLRRELRQLGCLVRRTSAGLYFALKLPTVFLNGDVTITKIKLYAHGNKLIAEYPPNKRGAKALLALLRCISREG